MKLYNPDNPGDYIQVKPTKTELETLVKLKIKKETTYLMKKIRPDLYPDERREKMND